MSRVDRYIKLRSKLLAFDSTDDVERFADRELAIHPGCGDPHSLLATRLTELVKFRTVQQLSEYSRDLALDNPRAVILDRDPRPLKTTAHLDDDLRQQPCFLASIEGVIYRFFDGSDQRFGWGVEPKQVAILQEEFRNGDIALPAGHFQGGSRLRLDVRHGSHF